MLKAYNFGSIWAKKTKFLGQHKSLGALKDELLKLTILCLKGRSECPKLKCYISGTIGPILAEIAGFALDEAEILEFSAGTRIVG